MSGFIEPVDVLLKPENTGRAVGLGITANALKDREAIMKRVR
jgi:hypothetical protein